MRRLSPKRTGFILIFTLWALGFLTVLAVSIASGVRQKVILVKKLDERSRMHYVMEAGIVQTKAYIHDRMASAQYVYSLNLKSSLHNNPSAFARIFLGGDRAQVSYMVDDQGVILEFFGVVDEERKININLCSLNMLQRLIERALQLKPDDAGHLAQSLIDWRQWGQAQATGYFSDDYYENLQSPYKKKDAPYEVLEEVLQVKGFTKDMYEKLLPYITIYTDGKININTVQSPVLYAMGLDDALIGKVLTARRGGDGVEATLDDHFFDKTFDVAAEVNTLVKLTPSEIQTIDGLNLQGMITTNSYSFTIATENNLSRSSWVTHARAVYNCRENKILYWSKK